MCHCSIDWPGIAHNRTQNTSRWSNIFHFFLWEMSFHCGWCRSTNACAPLTSPRHVLEQCAYYLVTHLNSLNGNSPFRMARNLNNSKLHKWSECTLLSRPKLLMIAMFMRSSPLRVVTRGEIVCSSFKKKIGERNIYSLSLALFQ